MDPFVHLHNHCEYSFLDGYGHPADFVARAKELGQPALAITDHGNISAHKRWNDECKKVGIKPILGVEAYVCEDAAVKKKGDRRWHMTLLAKDAGGYRNMLEVVSQSWELGFYYKPRTDWGILAEHSQGLIATSGCPIGRIGSGFIKEGWKAKEIGAELRRQAAMFKDYYVEVMPWTFPEGIAYARALYDVAKAEGFPMVMSMDAHYPRETDARTQDIMLCIQNGCQFNDPNRMKFSQQDLCLHSANTMCDKWMAVHRRQAPLLEEMITNTIKIADMVNLEFPETAPLAFPTERNKMELLRELCSQGMKAKGLAGKPVYEKRLAYELDLVASKDFVDYFLIVSDLIRWAKDQGIVVGAARGSSCGSLMCYVSRITEIDPLKHGLMFERFIDVSRSDLPDIDIDFESERRDEVKRYLEDKYGIDRVANLATFGTFKGRLCLQDIGRVFCIPSVVIEETKRLIVQRSSADARAGFTIEDTFTNFEQAAQHLEKYPELAVAKSLEGQVRQLGVHAAGVVLSSEPIRNYAAVYKTSSGDRVISMDYHDASAVGLLKIDILGLTVLTAIKQMLRLIRDRHGADIDIGSLDLEEQAVYEAFCRQELQGIFQFDGLATRQVNRQVKPECFEHLVAINALSRPGPLHSGGTTAFIARRHGREPVVPLHPMIEEVTRATYGITVYQEQVMQIVRDMGKFDWAETASIRKAMSKKFGNEFFNKMQEKFEQGAGSQGVNKEDAEAVWKNICTFGCVSGETRVKVWDGRKLVRIDSLYEKFQRAKVDYRARQFKFSAQSWNGGDGLKENDILDVVKTGRKEVFEVSIKGRRKIQTTADHRFMTPFGWTRLSDLKPGDLVAVEWHKEKGKPSRRAGNDFWNVPKSEKFFKALDLKNGSWMNSARWDASRKKISNGNKRYWDEHPELKDDLIFRIPDDRNGSFGKVCQSSDGHVCHSLNELNLEEWLIKNGLEHMPHPVIRTGKAGRPRMADQLVKGYFLEMDGMQRSADFWKEKYGDEIFRLIVITPNEDLDLKLAFLLDAKLSYVGTEKKGGNHLAMRWRMIQRIESKGIKDTYDLCMKAPWNSFIANGFIVHNSWAFNKSHSVAYSTVAYTLMWLKVHYPEEFYTCSINCETDVIKQRGILREYRAKKGKVLPVCINKSLASAVSCEPGGIRIGLGSVSGLKANAVASLQQFRPYRDYIDFDKRSKVPPKQADLLLKVGAFRDLRFESLHEQIDMFGANLSQREGFNYREPVEAFMKVNCPLAVEDKECEIWQKWYRKTFKNERLYTVRDLESIEEKTNVTILGYTNGFNLKNKIEESKSYGKEFERKVGEEEWADNKFDFLNFDVDDGTASVIVRVSYNQYPKFKKMLWELKPTDLVALKGVMNGVMWMVFTFQIVDIRKLRAKLEGKKALDANEKAFIEGKPRKWTGDGKGKSQRQWQ